MINCCYWFQMVEYLKIKEGFISQLLYHLRTSAIMDLIVKLVTCVENKNSRLEIAQVILTLMVLLNLNQPSHFLSVVVFRKLCRTLNGSVIDEQRHRYSWQCSHTALRFIATVAWDARPKSGQWRQHGQCQRRTHRSWSHSLLPWIVTTKFYIFIRWFLIVNFFLRKCTVDLLLDHMLGAGASESSIVNGVTIILALLEVRRPP